MSLYNDASLVMIPSAYKDGKLYSIKPTDGSGDFTFSRGSNLAATRVDENGLIEKGRENLLLQSNQFDTTWQLIDAGVNSGQTGYNNSSDAWLLRETTTPNFHYIRQASGITSGVGTFSFYAKKKDYDYIQFAQSGDGGNYANFNLANGTLGNSNAAFFIDRKIESVGNGWYRCSVTYSFGSGAYVGIALIRSDVSTRYDAYAGDITKGTYIQDAQLEAGLVATDYIETTTTTAQAGILEDMPRLDYSGGASCPSLLLEPQRTNLFANSENYSIYPWSNTDVNLTANYALSPEGKMNASLWEFPTTNTGARIQYVLGGVTIGTTYTQSYYIKSLSGNLTLRIGTSGAIVGEYEDITATNEWQRFEFTSVASGTTEYPRIQNISGTQGAQILVYGAQIEEGSYPTSYIPCYGAATTRSSDVCDDAGNNTIIKTQKGTLFVEIEALANDGTNRMISLTNGASTTTNATLYFRPTDNRIRFIYEINSVQQASITYDLPNVLQMNKFAAVYEQDRFVLFVNGAKVGEVTSGDVATEGYFTEVAFDRASQLPFYGKAKQLAYFPTALTDSEAIALTTI